MWEDVRTNAVPFLLLIMIIFNFEVIMYHPDPLLTGLIFMFAVTLAGSLLQRHYHDELAFLPRRRILWRSTNLLICISFVRAIWVFFEERAWNGPISF